MDKPPAPLWIMAISGRLLALTGHSGFDSWSLLAPQALEGVAAVGLLHATVRRWSGPAAGLLAGAALGFAFLTKMLQGFLVLPAFAIVYPVAAPTPLRRRIGQLLAAGGALIISAGWWVAIVELWPASSRPYLGGSTDNDVLELVLGYNGFGRLLGGSGNSTENGGGGGTGASGSSFGGATGLQRLFGSEMGNEISWLLPAALVALVAGLWITRRAPRTDRTRAAGHWERRTLLTARIGLAAMILAAGGWGFVLLARDSSWYPGLRYADLALTVVAAAGLVVPAGRLRKASTALLIAGMIGGLGRSACHHGLGHGALQGHDGGRPDRLRPDDGRHELSRPADRDHFPVTVLQQ